MICSSYFKKIISKLNQYHWLGWHYEIPYINLKRFEFQSLLFFLEIVLNFTKKFSSTILIVIEILWNWFVIKQRKEKPIIKLTYIEFQWWFWTWTILGFFFIVQSNLLLRKNDHDFNFWRIGKKHNKIFWSQTWKISAINATFNGYCFKFNVYYNVERNEMAVLMVSFKCNNYFKK